MIRKTQKKNKTLSLIITLVVIVGLILSALLIIFINKDNNSGFNNKDSANVVVVTPNPITTSNPKPIDKTENSITPTQEPTNSEEPIINTNKKIIVLDAGHGKSSGAMSSDEKSTSGYVNNGNGWGEWRHFKTGTKNEECGGSGCNQNHSCWYPIGNGDRSTEPNINLQNVLSAKKYLEGYGYEVRLTRETNDENPSFTKRVSKCYPNGDMTAQPDASAYVCVHSNAGGGRGSAYITCGSNYDQVFKAGYDRDSYVAESNKLGQIINSHIVNQTSLSSCGGGSIGGEGYLILFNKCPVPAAYMEIGFFDSSADLSILNSESDAIGKAIADAINEYFNQQ